MLFMILMILIIFMLINSKNKNKISVINETNEKKVEEEIYSSNIIEEVSYNAKDNRGNEYLINAAKGEIDISNSEVIFLTDVVAQIKLKNSEDIIITSQFGKYNITNYDTIFSQEVIVKYLDNTINSEYLDFSMLRDTIPVL